jgi:hypothetical protein
MNASVGRNAERQDTEEWLGPKDEHAVAAKGGQTPQTTAKSLNTNTHNTPAQAGGGR